jgi:hypothetical protein
MWDVDVVVAMLVLVVVFMPVFVPVFGVGQRGVAVPTLLEILR